MISQTGIFGDSSKQVDLTWIKKFLLLKEILLFKVFFLWGIISFKIIKFTKNIVYRLQSDLMFEKLCNKLFPSIMSKTIKDRKVAKG